MLRGIREIIFGLEDGLVSTLGVVTGIAEGTKDRFVIILSGVIVIAVESLSMAAGTYLATKSEEEALFVGKARRLIRALIPTRQPSPVRNAAIMGISYTLGGAVPVLPYLVFPVRAAIGISIGATVVALFLVGAGKARLTQTSLTRSAFEMAAVSLAAAALGFAIGKVAALTFPGIRI